MRLEDLIISPTPLQRQIIALRERVGNLLNKQDEAAVQRQAQQRLLARRDERIRELETELLRKRGELGGLRLTLVELIPKQLPAINARCDQLDAEEAALTSSSTGQGVDRG